MAQLDCWLVVPKLVTGRISVEEVERLTLSQGHVRREIVCDGVHVRSFRTNCLVRRRRPCPADNSPSTTRMARTKMRVQKKGVFMASLAFASGRRALQRHAGAR